MNSVPESPAAANWKSNFLTRNIGVQVRNTMATKFAPKNTAISSTAVGRRKTAPSVPSSDSGSSAGT